MQATSITIKYDTGQLDIANGDDASQIFTWLGSCEAFAAKHGVQYAGPRLRRIDCITQADEVPTAELVRSGD